MALPSAALARRDRTARDLYTWPRDHDGVLLLLDSLSAPGHERQPRATSAARRAGRTWTHTTIDSRSSVRMLLSFQRPSSLFGEDVPGEVQSGPTPEGTLGPAEQYSATRRQAQEAASPTRRTCPRRASAGRRRSRGRRPAAPPRSDTPPWSIRRRASRAREAVLRGDHRGRCDHPSAPDARTRASLRSLLGRRRLRDGRTPGRTRPRPRRPARGECSQRDELPRELAASRRAATAPAPGGSRESSRLK